MMLGLIWVAIALWAAMFVVLRLIYGAVLASLITTTLAAAMVVLWAVLPRRHRGRTPPLTFTS